MTTGATQSTPVYTDRTEELWQELANDAAREPAPGQWGATRCPAHEDRSPSLGFMQDEDGIIAIRCHAGCDTEAVVEALGFSAGEVRVAGLRPWPRRSEGYTAAPPMRLRAVPRQSTPCEDDPQQLYHPQLGRPTTAYRIRDRDGRLHAIACRWDSDEGKTLRMWRDGWGLNGVDRASLPLYGSELVPNLQDCDVVVYTEGEKAADACRVNGFASVAGGGASTDMSEWSLSVIDGHDVLVWADADEPGRSYAERTAERLRARNPDRAVRVFEWGTEGDDAYDYFAAGHTEGDLLSEWTSLPEFNAGPELPQLVLEAGDRDEVVDSIERALADSGEVYLLDAIPVVVRRKREFRDDGVLVFGSRFGVLEAAAVPALVASVREVLRRRGEDELVPAAIPQSLAGEVLKAHVFNHLQPVRGMLDAPSILADGSLLDGEGYVGGYYIDKSREYPPVPEAPTREDALAALDRMREPFVDFRYEHGDAAVSAVISAGISVVARPAIDGAIPALICDAAAPGSGKSLTARVLGILATGREPTLVPQNSDSGEEKKRIFSLALEGHRIIVIDNLTRPFGEGATDMFLTAGRSGMTDRMLGSSSTAKAPATALLVATGNNVTYHRADTVRRVLVARLRVIDQHPERRLGPEPGTVWRHQNLLQHCEEIHEQWLVDALTVVRAYVRAGLPRDPSAGGLLGSFEEWDRIVRGALLWLGAADPLETQPELSEDGERASLAAVQDALAQRYPGGFTASDIASDHDDALRPALQDAVGTTDLTPRKVSSWLRQNEDLVGPTGRYLRRRQGKTERGVEWRVEHLS